MYEDGVVTMKARLITYATLHHKAFLCLLILLIDAQTSTQPSRSMRFTVSGVSAVQVGIVVGKHGLSRMKDQNRHLDTSQVDVAAQWQSCSSWGRNGVDWVAADNRRWEIIRPKPDANNQADGRLSNSNTHCCDGTI